MIRALPRVALQLWIVLFVVFFGAEVVHLEPTLRVVTHVMFGVPLAVWAVWRLRGPVDRLDWAVLGLLLVYALVCLFSRDRTESLGTLALAAAYASWFLLLRRAGDLRGPIVLAFATGLAITLAFNAYLLIQEKATWYAAVGGAPFEGLMTFPWESVNALPVLVLVAIPFVSWLEPSRVRTTLASVIVVSAAIVVPLSMGRAGWLGLAIAGVVLLILHPTISRKVQRIRPGHRTAIGVGAAIAFVAVLIGIGPRAVTAIGESGRLLLWEQDLNMIASHPLLGSGPGTYSWTRLEFAPASADLLAVRLTHSVPLQTLVDGGVVLLASVLAATCVWAVTVLRRPWGTGDRVALAGVAGLLAAMVLDDFSYLPAIIAAVLAIAAILTPVPAMQPGPPAARWLVVAAVGLAGVVALPSVLAVDAARLAAQSARTDMQNGEYAEAMDGFDAASRAHPESGAYWLGLGMAAAYAGDDTRAIGAYERAMAAAPGDPRAYGALAALDPADDPVVLLRSAAERTLGDPQYAVRLGLALAEHGAPDEVAHTWARAVALQPELVRLLPYAATGVSMDDVADQAALVIRAEPRPAPAENLVNLWDIALATDELPADAGAAWQSVDAARHGELGRASALAHTAVAEAVYDPRGYRAVAAVAAFACDAAREERALELEAATGSEWVPRALEPRIRREFVFREASLGPSQPPGVGLDLEVERWPWSLVDRPEGCDP